jgi:putative component of membrane protein insertase Oxa1/YidC/SpoIIIJ protein YidD
MGRTTLSSRSADRIRRYQQSDTAKQMVGVCRFDPGCSSYALEAFETRPFPIALAMTMSRLLRCNPAPATDLDDEAGDATPSPAT